MVTSDPGPQSDAAYFGQTIMTVVVQELSDSNVPEVKLNSVVRGTAVNVGGVEEESAGQSLVAWGLLANVIGPGRRKPLVNSPGVATIGCLDVSLRTIVALNSVPASALELSNDNSD